MNPVIRNILVFVVAIFIGGAINIAIIYFGPLLIPFPEGVDPLDSENFIEKVHLLEMKHFIVPFLAHAIGTFSGAFIAARFSATKQMTMAFGVGLFFLVGGITMVMSMAAPVWFSALDLLVAYLPMGFLGGKFGMK